MKKRVLTLALAAALITASMMGCNAETDGLQDDAPSTEAKVAAPQIQEMMGTYHVDGITVINDGKDMGLSEADFNVCSTIEITEQGEIVCRGLYGDQGFALDFIADDGSCMYDVLTADARAAGMSLDESAHSAQHYTLSADYEGPTLVNYFYADSKYVKSMGMDSMRKDCLHVYLKAPGGTYGWYVFMECTKAS